jgi:hypothetical protein
MQLRMRRRLRQTTPPALDGEPFHFLRAALLGVLVLLGFEIEQLCPEYALC